MAEQWRSVPGFEGLYEVSDHGRVKSCAHDIIDSRGIKRHWHEKMLKRTIDANGHPRVTLSISGKRFYWKVSDLVMYVFAGRKLAGFEVLNKDGDKTNVQLGNLKYKRVKTLESPTQKHKERKRATVTTPLADPAVWVSWRSRTT